MPPAYFLNAPTAKVGKSARRDLQWTMGSWLPGDGLSLATVLTLRQSPMLLSAREAIAQIGFAAVGVKDQHLGRVIGQAGGKALLRQRALYEGAYGRSVEGIEAYLEARWRPASCWSRS